MGIAASAKEKAAVKTSMRLVEKTETDIKKDSPVKEVRGRGRRWGLRFPKKKKR